MSDMTAKPSLTARAIDATPATIARRVRGLSDRAIAWIFITPTIALLLAINIFPLIWTVRLSFTNFRANRPNALIKSIGLENYASILTDPEIWAGMQVTARFVIATIVIETVLGFALAYLIDRKFRGHGFWTTVILIPMMLSPAVVGNFWTFLYQPQIGLFNYLVAFFTGVPPSAFSMIGDVSLAPWSITLPMALPFIMLAVLFRGIENFKMFDLVNLLTNGGPGSTTELASITLKREAFEKWRTGYASALAMILFVTIFGLGNIYVKALNRVKQR